MRRFCTAPATSRTSPIRLAPRSGSGPRVLVASIVLGCTIWFTGCSETVVGTDDPTVFVERSFSFRLDAEGKTLVTLRGINGIVTVTAQAGADSFTVSGTRQVGSFSTEDAEAHLDSLQVVDTDLGDELRIETEQPKQAEGRQYRVDYELIVPDDVQIDMRNVNGNVEVSGMRSTVSAATANGNVVVGDVEGSVTGRAANGNVTAEVVLPGGGTVDLSTANGQLTLRVPTTTSASLDAMVGNGTILVQGLTVQDEVSTSTSLRGTLGTGDGTITLGTAKGTITIEGF